MNQKKMKKIRLIDAEVLKERIITPRANGKAMISVLIDSMPTVEAEPVKHGKWIRLGRTMGVFGYACSECGESVVVKNIKCELYCPNCGARMDAE